MDVLGNAVHGADGGELGKVDVGALAGHKLVGLYGGFLHIVADVVAHQHADMVVLNHPVELLRRVEQDVAAILDLSGGGAGDQPAVANAAHPPGGGGGAPANPHRRGRLEERLGRDRNVVAGVELALVSDVFLLPEAAH